MTVWPLSVFRGQLAKIYLGKVAFLKTRGKGELLRTAWHGEFFGEETKDEVCYHCCPDAFLGSGAVTVRPRCSNSQTKVQ